MSPLIAEICTRLSKLDPGKVRTWALSLSIGFLIVQWSMIYVMRQERHRQETVISAIHACDTSQPKKAGKHKDICRNLALPVRTQQKEPHRGFGMF
jgi:hypothetical protein